MRLLLVEKLSAREVRLFVTVEYYGSAKLYIIPLYLGK